MKHFKTLFLILVSVQMTAHAQTLEEAEKHYYDFSNNRLYGDNRSVIQAGEKLLPVLDKLHPQRQIFFSFYLGNAYEQEGQAEKALPLYLKVIEAQPDYHVVHRAVGYIYLMESNEMAVKVNASEDPAERKKLVEAYQDILAKALPHLEKDYACDPYEGTLESINRIMASLGERAKPGEFKQRIEKLAENCVTILEDKF